MDAYGHLRMLISLILGLTIARVLSGLSLRLQEPEKTDHLYSQVVWSFVILLNTVHFWWWEFSLRHLTVWNFWIYVFILSYASLFFLMSTLLYPDRNQGNADRELFFIQRRHIFFSLFLVSMAFDLTDTIIKGQEHLRSMGVWYVVRSVAGVIIAIAAMRTDQKRLLTWLGLLWLSGNIAWITLYYSALI